MKRKLAFASLLVLAACGPSREAMTALDQMRITQNGQQPGISYGSLSGSGNDVTLSNVQVLAPASAVAMLGGDDQGEEGGSPPAIDPNAAPVALVRADKLTFKGLTMKDGKPLARDIVLSQVSPAMPLAGATTMLGSVGVEGMNEATGAYVAALLASDQTAAMPALEQWRFSRVGFGGLKVTASVPQEEGEAGSVDVTFDEAALLDFTGVKLGKLRLSGLKGSLDIPGMPPVAGTFDFGKFEATTINTKLAADLIGSAINQAANPEEPANFAEFYSGFTSPIESYVDRVDWTGMKADFSGLKFGTSPMQAYVTRNADGVAVATNSPRFTAKLTADASGGTLGAMGLMMLAMGGYDSNEIELFVEGGATFDPAKDVTRLVGYHVGVTDFFDVKMSGGVIGLKQAMPSLMQAMDSLVRTSLASEDNEEVFEEGEEDVPETVPEYDGDKAEDDADAPEEDAAEDEAPGDEEEEDSNPFGSDPAALMALMMGILPLQLTDLDIEITDRKLVTLVMNNQAVSAGFTPEQFRSDIVGMVAASSVFMSDAGVDAAIAQEMTSAASAFLAGPGTLRIQLKPKTPLGVMSAFAMPMTKDSLGFSATFTPVAPATN